jgi:LmbE family N-acetylglucosaminyl deacetylase
MNVLVVAAHPDDEVLGCGGAMVAHSRAGDSVHTLILATGIASRGGVNREQQLSSLRSAAHEANRGLGVASIKLCDFPDNQMDTVPLLDIIKIVEDHVTSCSAQMVYTHHAGDLNLDHRIVHDAVLTACRPIPGHSCKSILFFEVVSSTEWQPFGNAGAFVPNWFLDAKYTLDAKLKALQVYASEMRPWPHARSIQAVEHLARWRGASVGLEAAEAFVLGRRIVSFPSA